MRTPAVAETDRLIAVTLDEDGLGATTPEIEQDRRVAVYDLLEANLFALPPHCGRNAPAGPYRLLLAIRDRGLVFRLTTGNDEWVGEFHLSLMPLTPVVKDYFQICESYFDAVRRLPPVRIEAIDMGRRGIHDEGARILFEQLEGKLETDMATARRLFTLICALRVQE
jgi:uncharacterized protein (UPF0262 family)